MITENSLLRDIIRVLESDSEVADRYSKKLEDLRQKKIIAQSHTYKVGVIGVTSSGKSTMINAIMKNDLLPTGVHPSSSQLVTCSKSKNNDDTVTVYFEETAPEIYKNKEAAKALKNYGDEKYNPENRWGVKQIEISTPGYLFPEEVILVDSPGLDAYGYDNHEALTLEVLLPVIDFCIFVTTCKTNSDKKMQEFLNTIAKYDKPLIIVQNMIDSVSPELKKDKTVKKTVDQVLKEHRGRLMRVVKASNVKEKENIRIVQVSARMALKGYTKKRSADIRKSNFESFLGAIREIFNIVRPRIEADRFDNIRNEVSRIVDEGYADLSANQEALNNLTFEYEGYLPKIYNTFGSFQSSLEKTIEALKREKEMYSVRVEIFTPSTIKEIRASCRKKEKSLIEAKNHFDSEMKAISRKLNCDYRDLVQMVSFASSRVLKLETTIRSRRVKKSGIVSGVKRFFGWFVDADWGYEYVSETVYDHEKTKKAVRDYYDYTLSTYENSVDQWVDKAEQQWEILIKKYDSELDNFNKRKEGCLKKEKQREVIEKLEKIIARIPVSGKSVSTQSVDIKAPELQFDLVNVPLSERTYSLVGLANMVCSSIHHSVFNAITNGASNDKCYVIGWDTDSIASFIGRSFGLYSETLSDNYYKEMIEGVTVYVKPSPKHVNELKQFLHRFWGRYIFIMLNAQQFGSGLSEIDKSGIMKVLTPEDNVYFVVQDFGELITGEGVKEAVNQMTLIGGKLSFDLPYKIMLNHPNPIYTLAAAELQLGDEIIMADKTKLIKELQEKFSYLCGAKESKIINEIAEGFITERK